MDQESNGKVLGELESDVMQIVWQQKGPISVREVTGILQNTRKIAYTTVMTIMGRLTQKGVLTRKLKGSSYLYLPKVTREQFIAKAAHRIFSTAVSNLGEGVASYFLKEIQKLHPKKRQELLKILDGKKAKHDY